MHLHWALAFMPAILLAACDSENTPSSVKAPGAAESAGTRVLEAGAAAL